MHTARLTPLWRIARLAFHLGRGLFTAAVIFPFQTAERRNRTIQRWSVNLLGLLRVHLHVHGAPDGRRPLMLVANHVSWLDIFAINSVIPVRFVAKAEVRAWPMIGWLSERAGTLFIERARPRDAVRINAEVAVALRSGAVFAVFPEGTTTDGSTVLKFHSSLLEPALKAGAAILPVALCYEREDGSLCREAAYDGARSAWDALVGIVSESSVIVHVCLLPHILPCNRDRRTLALEARRAISLTLFPEAPRSRTETADDRAAVTQ
jgi:1-acyl-sn-glycerol-3-phosphate acyltransferase